MEPTLLKPLVIFYIRGLNKVEVEEVKAGDIVSFASRAWKGSPLVRFYGPTNPVALPTIKVEEPQSV
ncbi:MAG: hypothetical protein IPO22_02115 [Anaerolineales bacterium]|nr:hypothetical protein [Anaerolineales bacterium]